MVRQRQTHRASQRPRPSVRDGMTWPRYAASPYGGFPDGVRVENGHITMPDLPGIGFEDKSDLYTEMKALAA